MVLANSQGGLSALIFYRSRTSNLFLYRASELGLAVTSFNKNANVRSSQG